MKNSYYLWIIALIVVNTGWYAVSQQSAIQEINRPGADFSEAREGELSTLIGSDVDLRLNTVLNQSMEDCTTLAITVESESETLYTWEGLQMMAA